MSNSNSELTQSRLTASYDPETNALYVRVRDLPIQRTVIRDVGHNTDIGADDHIVGHEFLLDEPIEILTSEATVNTGPAFVEGSSSSVTPNSPFGI